MYIYLQDLITFWFVSLPAKTHSKIKILFHTHFIRSAQTKNNFSYQ